MAKGVLGNDPFLRGAPAREETAIKTPMKPAPPTPKPLPMAPAKPPRPPRPQAAKQAAPQSSGKKEWPKAAAKNKPAKASVRQMMSKKAPPANSPVLGTPPKRLRDWEPTSHPGSPDMVLLIDGVPTPHSGSPELVMGKLVEPPTRLKEFVPHAHSPEVLEVIGAEAIAHHGSPEVVANLREEKAVPHAFSPEMVEVRVAPRDEIPMMTAREVGRDDSRSPVVALGFARAVFRGGIIRPLAGAARGLFDAARTALGVAGGTELDVWGKDLSLTRSLEPLSDFLYDRYFRVTVEGADHVPAGPVILVANHSGALPLDGMMLYLALRRERADLPDARWLMEDQVFHAPFIGVLANRLGAVRANPENATRLLEERRPVAVFPEGIQGISKPFGERYQLKRFGRGGYVKLAARLNVPIVPVAIVGAEESMPLLARLPGRLLGLPYLPITVPPLPAKWHIRFAEPMELDGSEDDLAWVTQMNDRTRATIEGMLTAMLRERTSVF